VNDIAILVIGDQVDQECRGQLGSGVELGPKVECNGVNVIQSCD